MSWLMGDRGGRNCRWVLAAAEKSEFGVCGVVGGMMVIELLAYTMRQDCGGIAAGEMRGVRNGECDNIRNV